MTIDGHDDLECGALLVAGGAWSAELGELLGCPLPIMPTKGQIVHLGTTQDSDHWPIVQPLLTHYLVPWPGGRVACGGTFEAGAGFSATVTAAGLHELLRECLAVAPGLADAEYLYTRVGLRPTSTDDRPCRRGDSRLGERVGGDGSWGERAAAMPLHCGASGLQSEDSWFAPFADRVTRRSAGRVREITPAAAATLFPPLGPVHRVLHYADAARIDGRGMAAAVRQASERVVRVVRVVGVGWWWWW